MIEILPMRHIHTVWVARLHMENLPTPFAGRAGRKLLTLYYSAVAQEIGGCGFVAISEHELLGYVCGIWDVHKLRNTLIRAYWHRLILWGIIQLTTKPSLLRKFLNRFHIEKSTGKLTEETKDRSQYELRPIVVVPKMRGDELGVRLVERLLEDARSRGYLFVYLFTEDNNVTAHRLYKKTGFREVERSFSDGVPYLRFELCFSLAGMFHES